MSAPRKGSKFRAYIWRNSEFMGLFEAAVEDLRPVWSKPKKVS